MAPKLVYICAPLRGDINANIEAARLHAKRVFEQGDVPVCPHLMFPPVADPADPEQDRQAMQMCLQVLARCDQINVYGDEYTAGMREEIAYAHLHGIPIEYKPMKRGRTQRQPNRPQQSLCR